MSLFFQLLILKNLILMQIIKKVIYLSALLGVGLALGWGLGRLLKGATSAPSIPIWWLLTLIPIILVGIILGILLHELGHAIAGYFVGFKFRFLTAGPFMWEKEADGRLVFKWNKSLNTSGGLTLCLPEKSENLRLKFMFYGAGGPLMSFLSAFLFLLLYSYLPSSKGVFGPFLLNFTCLIWGLLSFGFFLITIIPFYVGGFYTDGARILSLWRNGNKGKVQVALLTEMSRSIAGTRPRELDEKSLQEVLPLSHNPAFTFSLIHYLYLIALDRKEYNLAQEKLNELLQISFKLPPLFSRLTYLESAYYESFFHQDISQTQYYLSQVGATNDAFIPKALYFKAEAAIALANQNYPLAIQKATLALGEIPNLWEKGNMLMQTELIEAIISLAQEKQAILGDFAEV